MGAYRPNMRVLAVSFPDDDLAHRARARLMSELSLSAHQVGVEPLAEPGDGASAQAVLAGQFPDDQVPTARLLLEQLGGTVMLDIDATASNA